MSLWCAGFTALRERYPWGLTAGVVAVVTLAVMAPSVDGAFLNWDDDRFVVNNPHVQTLSWESIAHAFSGLRFESYQPLHLISYMIDGALWPGFAPGYRSHNLVLYLCAVMLLLLLLKRVGLPPFQAALGCLVFAVAPYRVESVAWIAGRKDVLMLCFALGAWHLHLSAGERPQVEWRRQGLALLLFLAALLSKSSALVVPAMMAIVDVGLLGRPIKRSLVSIAPFALFALVLAAALPIIWRQAELVREPAASDVLSRLTLVGWTIGHYVDTLIWPFRLSPIYAEPTPEMLSQGMRLGFGALLCLVAVLWIARVKQQPVRKPLVVISLFLSALAPFLNFVPMYYLVADRYLLLPSVALAFGAGFACLTPTSPVGRSKSRQAPGMRRAVTALFIVVIIAYGAGTLAEGRAWRTSESLWQHAALRAPGSFYVALKLGETLRNAGRPAESADAYRRALKLKPLSPVALGGLFWGELLVDAAAVPDLSRDKAEKLAFQFVAVANDGEKLLSLARYLKRRGLRRAAKVVMDRVYPSGAPAR